MAQSTLLSILQTTTAELNLTSPQIVMSSTDGNIIQLYNLLVAASDDLCNEFDWQFLQERITFNTVNGQATYDLEPDYLRFINGTCFDQTNRWPMRGPMTPIQWEILTTFQIAVGPFERFRIFQNEINLYPVPGENVYTFVYDYISNYYVVDANTGETKVAFTQDSDLSVFPKRLLVYATKLKYLQTKGLDTTVAQNDYTSALELYKGQDTPAPRLLMAPTGFRVLSTGNYPDGSYNS